MLVFVCAHILIFFSIYWSDTSLVWIMTHRLFGFIISRLAMIAMSEISIFFLVSVHVALSCGCKTVRISIS